MPRNLLNYFVDFLSLLAFLTLVATGLLMWQTLPPGSRGGHGLTLWGMDRHQWGDIHLYTALGMLGLMVLHVALHWDWVVAVTRIQVVGRKDPASRPSTRRQNLYGVAFLAVLIVLVGGFWWIAESNVVGSGASGERGREWAGRDHASQEEPRESEVSGRMTLAEAARYAGVSAGALKAALGLPMTVPDDSRLGPLRREYGLEMSDIRSTIDRLSAATRQLPARQRDR